MATLLRADPPRFSNFRALRWRKALIRGIEVGMSMMAVVLMWPACDLTGLSPFLFLSEPVLAPRDSITLILICSACLAGACGVRWLLRNPESRAEAPSHIEEADAVALCALPTGFPLARLSRLPFVAPLLKPRIEFLHGALAVAWLKWQKRVPYREIARTEWQHDGVLLLLRDGRRLLLPTCRPPRLSGPSAHYPELRRAVQMAALAALRHNQRVAERIEAEIDRMRVGPAYRAAPQA